MVTEQVPDSPEAPVVSESAELLVAAPEGQAPAAEEGEAQPEPQVDWEARYTESEARWEKSEAALKSLQGNALKDAEVRGSLSEMSARAEASEKATKALVKAINSGQTEGLPQELDQIEQEAVTARRQAGFVNKFQALTEELKTIEGVEDGGPEEFGPIRQIWNGIVAKSNNGADTSDLLVEAYEGLKDAYRIDSQLQAASRQADQAKAQKAIETAKEAGAADALEDAGVYNTDVGTAPAQAGPLSDDALISDEQRAKTRTMNRGELKQRQKELTAAVMRTLGG